MNESERQLRAAVHACGEDYDTVGTLHCPDATCETIYAVARDIDRQRKEAEGPASWSFTSKSARRI